ncbi:MAG: YlxR family protein [Lachnospiraceae bacterium]|jgi:predicted RNA-binding protein YlxR (DUF448 family)|nr:YlxR family protein [Lachnospiraceae bacterium]
MSQRQQTATKKKPQRTCLGCREVRNKNELVRIVRTPEGEVIVDAKGRANGRGAYICSNTECLKKAVRTRALERALKVEIPEAIFESLARDIEK